MIAKIQFFILVHITHNLDTELWVITAFLLWPINKNRYLQLLSHQHQPCPSVYSCPEDKEYSVLCTAQTNKLQQVIKLEVKFLLRQYTQRHKCKAAMASGSVRDGPDIIQPGKQNSSRPESTKLAAAPSTSSTAMCCSARHPPINWYAETWH